MAKNNGTVVKKRKTMNVRKINNIKMESSHVLMWEKKTHEGTTSVFGSAITRYL